MKLNKRQRIALWIGIGAVAAIGMFPPFEKKGGSRYTDTRRYVGYQFLFRDTEADSDELFRETKPILIGRWIGTIATTSLLTLGVVVALKDGG